MDYEQNKVEETRQLYGSAHVHSFMKPLESKSPYLEIEHAKNYICVVGNNGFLKKMSNSFCKASGYSKEELLSRPFREFIVVNGLPAPAAIYGSGDMNFYFKNSIACKGGDFLDVTWRSVPDIIDDAFLIVGWEVR